MTTRRLCEFPIFQPNTTLKNERGDGQWGKAIGGNATHPMFNGMAGDLLSGQIDLIIASFTLTSERSQAIQYLPPIGQEKGALFVRSDDTETVFSWLMFVEPFTMALWLMILVVALINASFISVINYFYKKRKQVVFT